MLNAMRAAAAAAGLRELIAPVRPTRKADYPLIPIERYMTWRRSDGTHFDPWIRVHEVVGGEIHAPAPDSMTMEAPVAPRGAWRRRPARRAERVAKTLGGSGLAAPALACPFELSPLLPVLRDSLGLLRGRVEIGLALARCQS
jgi:hypothetical protein